MKPSKPHLPPANCRVLVVADDPRIGALVAEQVGRLGCASRWVADGESGLAEAHACRYQLAIVDAALPCIDGFEVLRRLRSHEQPPQVMMMAADEAEVAAVLALDPMADDYLIKPFGALELAARVAGLLRRRGAATADAAADDRLIELDGLRIDLRRRLVLVRGSAVELTAREYDLLVHFAGSPGRVFSRPELLDRIWGFAHDVYEHTVNSHINRLRGKIERDPARPSYIQTVWGVGYRFAQGRG